MDSERIEVSEVAKRIALEITNHIDTVTMAREKSDRIQNLAILIDELLASHYGTFSMMKRRMDRINGRGAVGDALIKACDKADDDDIDLPTFEEFGEWYTPTGK